MIRSDTAYYSDPMYSIVLDQHRHLHKKLESHALGDRSHLGVDVIDETGRIVVSSSTRELANTRTVAGSIREAFGRLEPGDAVVTNDPYSGSQHVQDHWVIVPNYANSRYLGLVLVHAHLADVGGRSLGNYFPEARDVWQEGIRTTPVRLYRHGSFDRDVMETIKFNTRLPDLMERDLQELVRVAQGTGDDVAPFLVDGAKQLWRLSEQVLRMPINPAMVPPATSEIEIHNCGGPDARISMDVSFQNGRVVVDFVGSSEETDRGFINSTLTNTESTVVDVIANRLKAVPNSDVLELADIRVSPASVVSCSFPLAVGWSPHMPREAIRDALDGCCSDLGLGGDYQVYRDERRPPVQIAGCREERCPF